jgi:hypothetical protein
MKRSLSLLLLSLPALLAFAYGQGGQRGQRGGPPPTPRQAAPIDLTGYWVAVITEDWRWRVTTPPKGDVAGVPVNAEARRLTELWDPAKDEAAKEECKAYGAVNIMRVPGRIHIAWQDDQTLKLETDSGMQTRLFYFGEPQGRGGTWQGVSKAEWEGRQTGSGFFAQAGLGEVRGGSLKVTTTKLRPGYIRRNGVPYSANAVLTEYFDVIKPNKDTYLVISTNLDDPTYLNEQMRTAVHFKKQADASGWKPTPCSAR